MDKLNVYEKLSIVTQQLKVPKGQKNAFGNYKYRSCEDILEAVKPLLNGANLFIKDDVVEIGTRIYVKATAVFYYNGEKIEITAFAREAANKKGMDEAQITGSASSYARKYALNGLFCIDDTKDPDSLNNSSEYTAPKSVANKASSKDNVFSMCKANGIKDVKKFLKFSNINGEDEISMQKVERRFHDLLNKYKLANKIMSLCIKRGVREFAEFSVFASFRKDDVGSMQNTINNIDALLDKFISSQELQDTLKQRSG